MVSPPLKQFADLAPSDFEHDPVWIGCHTADYDQPWYDDTDEETFRPRSGPLPANPSEGMLLVRATAHLADGTTLRAVVTPADSSDLGIMQPQVFVRGSMVGFWGGVVGVADDTKSRFHNETGKARSEVFPMRVIADLGLATGSGEVTVNGWPDEKPEGGRRRWFSRRG